MMKIALLRTSTLDQTPALQLRDIKSIANGEELTEFSEQVSAWKNDTKRPVFDECVSLIRKGKVSDIYVWDLDRIHRNRKKLKEFFILCKITNTKVHSYNQAWLESINSIQPPFDEIVKDLMINLIGWLGEDESQKKSARVLMSVRKKDGMKTLSYKGNVWGRKPLPPQTVTRVMGLHKSGRTIREIAAEVIIYDRNNNGRNISKSAVHKIIAQNVAEKHS